MSIQEQADVSREIDGYDAADAWGGKRSVRALKERIRELESELAETRAKLESMTNWCASAKPARKTPAEQAVLDACSQLDIRMPSVHPRPPARPQYGIRAGLAALIDAELARREEKTNDG